MLFSHKKVSVKRMTKKRKRKAWTGTFVQLSLVSNLFNLGKFIQLFIYLFKLLLKRMLFSHKKVSVKIMTKKRKRKAWTGINVVKYNLWTRKFSPVSCRTS